MCCLCLTLLAEDDATGGAKKKGAAGKAGAKGGGSHKPPKSRWQRLSKVLFGWTNSTFKVNGKKLLPHNAVLWKFMVRHTAWWHGGGGVESCAKGQEWLAEVLRAMVCHALGQTMLCAVHDQA
jgi:hypothetical protein